MEPNRPTAFTKSDSLASSAMGAPLRHGQPLTNWARPVTLPPTPLPVWPAHCQEATVRLLPAETSVVTEVWDGDPTPSVMQNWNYCLPRSGGKVVWCEISPRSCPRSMTR
ncbi:hypothetical protein FHR81_002273 [Actinoalloteichus hoggarensis]|uniref:Uncharacterized protein n=1 Tax=Actinoalloteichus hoggarensis TaxID=1470176 RepID=A0A221W5T9_9PSEU|nr:hypothetical protein AHOG_18385 [Actinoalloteichus hoggarensis]MBB5921235.1 hypothetical protein [Actinoalloteichus hoggarensis]